MGSNSIVKISPCEKAEDQQCNRCKIYLINKQNYMHDMMALVIMVATRIKCACGKDDLCLGVGLLVAHLGTGRVSRRLNI